MEKAISNIKFLIWFKAFKLILKLIIPLVFLATGLILFYLSIPGWSLILGIPSIIFGITFLIYVYDEIGSQTEIHDNDGKFFPPTPEVKE
jgi:hypothetical protein